MKFCSVHFPIPVSGLGREVPCEGDAPRSGPGRHRRRGHDCPRPLGASFGGGWHLGIGSGWPESIRVMSGSGPCCPIFRGYGSRCRPDLDQVVAACDLVRFWVALAADAITPRNPRTTRPPRTCFIGLAFMASPLPCACNGREPLLPRPEIHFRIKSRPSCVDDLGAERLGDSAGRDRASPCERRRCFARGSPGSIRVALSRPVAGEAGTCPAAGWPSSPTGPGGAAAAPVWRSSIPIEASEVDRLWQTRSSRAGSRARSARWGRRGRSAAGARLIPREAGDQPALDELLQIHMSGASASACGAPGLRSLESGAP